MIRHRGRWLLVLGLVMAVSATPLLLLTVKSNQVRRSTLEQVTIGMTRDQVLARVGRPPGNHTDPPRPWPFYFKYDVWAFNSGSLLVRFDDQDRAVDVQIWDPSPPPPNLIERCLDWLGF